MNIITNNPFRTLGVYSNASAKEIAANKAKLAAYLKVGKNVEFPIDKLIVESVERTTESVDKAVSDINLAADKLKHALFWFIKSSPIDEIALNYLAAGDKEKASELFGKKETFSSLQNTSTLALYNEDYDTAIAAATKMIHEDELRTAFVKAVCGETFLIEEDEMAHLFIDTLCEELPNEDWRQIFNGNGESSDDDEYLNAKAVGKPLKQIENAIDTAKNADGNNAEVSYKAGTTLMNSTKKQLAELKTILGTGDMQYQMIADKLANQILQCGINYFNNTDDDNAPQKATTLQNYALSIAIGELIKGRCRENVDILNKIGKEYIVRKELAKLTEYIKDLRGENTIGSFSFGITIPNITKIVDECIPLLNSMKNKLGFNSDLYINISSVVASSAVNALVKVVNLQQALSIGDENKLKSVISDAITLMATLGNMDMDSKTRNYYGGNKNTLDNINSKLNPSGCYIATMVYGDYDHPQVMRLRKFRDEVLEKNCFGRAFVKFYYRYSPTWVEHLKNKKTINKIIRKILDRFIKILNK